MQNNYKLIFAAISLLVLANCAGRMDSGDEVSPDTVTKDLRFYNSKIVSRGSDGIASVNLHLNNRVELKKTLKSFLTGSIPSDEPSEDLGDLILEVETARDGITTAPGLTGMGGTFANAVLKAAKWAKKGNGRFDTTHQIVVSMAGRIEKYRFNQVAGEQFGTGELWVDTYITTTKIPHGNGKPNSDTEAYRWKIRVNNNAFRISRWDGSGFPGVSLPFDAEMIARVKALGLNIKLFAEGMNIEIMEVAKKRGASNVFTPIGGNFGTKLTTATAANCIDILFKVQNVATDNPPDRLSPNDIPPFYCLGRCSSPLIINTGF